jgi:hypothetical protein
MRLFPEPWELRLAENRSKREGKKRVPRQKTKLFLGFLVALGFTLGK